MTRSPDFLVSIVWVCAGVRDARSGEMDAIPDGLSRLASELELRLGSPVEFVLVGVSRSILRSVGQAIRSSVPDGVRNGESLPIQYVLLGEMLPRDAAVVAGLSRSNGDAAIVIPSTVGGSPELATDIITAIRDGADIAVVRATSVGRSLSSLKAFALSIAIAKSCGADFTHRDLQILGLSRKAVAWILRYRANSHFLPDAYIQSPLSVVTIGTGLARQFRSGGMVRPLTLGLVWPTLTRYSSLPTRILRWLLYLLSAMVAVVTLNAVLVVVLGRNILGGSEVQVPGWATLVILVGVGLVITNLGLLIVVKTLHVATREIRSDPQYSVQAVLR